MAWTHVANIKGVKGDSLENPRIVGDDLVVDEVVRTSSGSVAYPTTVGNVRGPQGLPGMDAVPTDAAVAGYVSTTGTSETKSAIQVLVRNDRTPRAFGAVGDGVTDDTAALQSWLNAGGGDLGRGADYRITAGLSVTADDVRIVGDHNTRILMDGDLRGFSITGHRARLEGAFFDGNGKAQSAIWIYGEDAQVLSTIIRDCLNPVQARAIHVEGAGGSIVQGNFIENIQAVGNEIGGDGSGMSRGIVIYNPTVALKPTLVSDNIVRRIYGEEGDSITVLHSVDAAIDPDKYVTGLTTVQGNRFDGASRRHIKIQSSDAVVSDNVVEDTTGLGYTSPSNCIAVIQSDRPRISGNKIRSTPLLQAIAVAGTATSKIADPVVTDNDTALPTGSTQNNIYVADSVRAAVLGNRTKNGSRSVSIGGTAGGVVGGNVHFDGLTAAEGGRCVAVTSSCSNVAMVNNTDINPPRYRAFYNEATNGVSANNVTLPA